MSLTTYAAIRSAILDWSWVQGGLTDTIIKNDIFPQLWAMIYYGDRTKGLQPIEPLRIRAMQASATLTPSSSGVVTISSAVITSRWWSSAGRRVCRSRRPEFAAHAVGGRR